MLSGVHVLLTYRCTHECDHCFVHASPRARGTFTLRDVEEVLAQAAATGTVEWIWFEGGEPFLYFPLLLRAVESARERGFSTGVVTNAYFAETAEDAALWLEPLARAGLTELAVSDDDFHHDARGESPAARARRAAERLGIPVGSISIPRPGEGEGVRFRGRAADTLVDGLPRRPAREFTTCPDEDLRHPARVHVDPSLAVHLCQGLLMGNLRDVPLGRLLAEWRPEEHPVVGPLLRGGPAELARAHGFDASEGYVSACHLCYRVRDALRGRYPAALGPPSVYGR